MFGSCVVDLSRIEGETTWKKLTMNEEFEPMTHSSLVSTIEGTTLRIYNIESEKGEKLVCTYQHNEEIVNVLVRSGVRKSENGWLFVVLGTFLVRAFFLGEKEMDEHCPKIILLTKTLAYKTTTNNSDTGEWQYHKLKDFPGNAWNKFCSPQSRRVYVTTQLMLSLGMRNKLDMCQLVVLDMSPSMTNPEFKHVHSSGTYDCCYPQDVFQHSIFNVRSQCVVGNDYMIIGPKVRVEHDPYDHTRTDHGPHLVIVSLAHFSSVEIFPEMDRWQNKKKLDHWNIRMKYTGSILDEENQEFYGILTVADRTDQLGESLMASIRKFDMRGTEKFRKDFTALGDEIVSSFQLCSQYKRCCFATRTHVVVGNLLDDEECLSFCPSYSVDEAKIVDVKMSKSGKFIVVWENVFEEEESSSETRMNNDIPFSFKTWRSVFRLIHITVDQKREEIWKIKLPRSRYKILLSPYGDICVIYAKKRIYAKFVLYDDSEVLPKLISKDLFGVDDFQARKKFQKYTPSFSEDFRRLVVLTQVGKLMICNIPRYVQRSNVMAKFGRLKEMKMEDRRLARVDERTRVDFLRKNEDLKKLTMVKLKLKNKTHYRIFIVFFQ